MQFSGGSGVNSAQLQQKMMRQRQLAVEKQRAANRSRLGAGLVAQANPLAPPAGQLKAGRGLLGDVVVQPAVLADTPKGASAGAGGLLVMQKGAEDDLGQKGAEASRSRKQWLDDSLDELACEVLAEDTQTAQLRKLHAEEISALQAKLTEQHNSPKRAQQPAPVHARGMMQIQEVGHGADSNAWGGAGGFAPGGPPGARPLRGGTVVIDQVEEAHFDEKDRRPARVVDRGGEARMRGGAQQWDLNAQQEAVQPKRQADGGGKKWWKPWSPGTVEEDNQVTQVGAFTDD